MSQPARKRQIDRGTEEYEGEDDEVVEVTHPYQQTVGQKPGTSEKTAIELLEIELQQPQLNVQEIGRIITNGIIVKQLNDDILKECAKKWAKNFHAIHDINIWDLAEDLNRGSIDSRLVVIGNSFLWNLLKTGMSTIRDKFDHYQFKMSTSATGFAATKQMELISTRAREGDYVVMNDTIFAKNDLLTVYNRIAFRKNSDLQSKIKQFVKAYLAVATAPKCAIWYYSLRLSGTSHKKTLQDFPGHVLDALTHFLLALADLGDPELEIDSHEKLTPNNRYFNQLATTKEERIIEFENFRAMRENLIAKFRSCVSDALNECREMPFNTLSCELLPPPRGKHVDYHNTVTWRQYEGVVKRSQVDPSKENLEAKRDLEYRLGLAYHHVQEQEEDLDVNITH